jgi:hypothetical protein
MELTPKQEEEFEKAKKKIDQAVAATSRTFLDLCKNKGCYNQRRTSSCYCQSCSDKNKKKLNG